QDINGTAASVAYDSLGRLGTTTNILGQFTRSYDSVTPRLMTLNYPNGQTSNYTYFPDNSHDRRLQFLQHLTSGSVNLSSHAYTYDPEGQIQTWTKTLGAQQSTLLTFSYDNAQQLTGVSYLPQQNLRDEYDYDNAGNRLTDLFFATHLHGGNTYTANNLNQLDSVVRDPGNAPATGPFPLTYDANGNLTNDGANQTFEWDAANRLIAIYYADTGNRTEFAYDGLGRRVRITEEGQGLTAVVQPATSNYTAFTAEPFLLAAGTYTLKFEGLDPNGGDNTAFVDAVTLNNTLVANGSFESPTTGNYVYDRPDSTWSYQGDAGLVHNGSGFGNVNAPDGVQAAFVQENGVVWQTFTTAGGTYTLSFQAAQRGNFNPTFQQVRVTVQQYQYNPVVKTFVWCGNTICEQRDSTGSTVTKRFFAEGEQIGGSAYFYTRDHLGSIREVTDASGALQGQYDYGAWGNSVVVSGKINVDFGYTGHYFHQPSGLNLALYRAYSPTLARWISRDPIAEAGGVNLYAYVTNDPIRLTDPLGTDTYWHDVQDTMAGFISGFIPGLPFDTSNDAMRYGREIGIGTGVIVWTDAIMVGANTRASTVLTALLAAEEADELGILGRSVEDIDAMMKSRGCRPEQSRLGGGIRYPHPTNRGEQVRVQPGNPADPNPIKQGPYARISKGGTVSPPIPLKGNPSLDQ
ncbi:MAG: RHS repeat-associated core domain-containing protein, partial [Chthoniobacterales bacterium]